jgi:Ecdysteroid kinase-like family
MNPLKFYDAISKMREVVYTNSATKYYSQVLDSTLAGAVTSLSSYSNATGELDRPIEILKRLKGEQLYGIMSKHLNGNNKWKVLCHGDLWINNLMFHYHNSKVKHVKFVDLQTIRYANLSCDILMFLYSSTEGDLRHQHMDRLLQIYQESLIDNLREYLEKKYPRELATLEREFSFENIKNEFAIRSLYGLGTSLWVMPAITFKSLSSEIDSFVGSMEKIMQPKEFHERVRDIVKEFYERGFLDNIFIDI